MDKFFSKPFFEKWIKEAAPEIKDWFQKEIEYLQNNIKPDSKILDVGCGFGRHIQILAGFSKEVIGIDDDENMIRKAKQNLANLDNVKVFLQEANNLNFDDDSFDYVVCMTNTFGNFPDIKVDVLKEMKRVCKEGGRIIISVYSEKALEIRKKDYEKVGLHITKIKNGTIYSEEGLTSEQFTKPQLENLFNYLNLNVRIIEPNPISYLCEAVKEAVKKE